MPIPYYVGLRSQDAFDCGDGNAEGAFKDYFVQNCTVHNHITRHCLNFQLPLHRTNIRANSIRVSGVKFWNSISLELRQKPSVFSFKRNIKKYLISLY